MTYKLNSLNFRVPLSALMRCQEVCLGMLKGHLSPSLCGLVWSSPCLSLYLLPIADRVHSTLAQDLFDLLLHAWITRLPQWTKQTESLLFRSLCFMGANKEPRNEWALTVGYDHLFSSQDVWYSKYLDCDRWPRAIYKKMAVPPAHIPSLSVQQPHLSEQRGVISRVVLSKPPFLEAPSNKLGAGNQGWTFSAPSNFTADSIFIPELGMINKIVTVG